MNLLRLTHSMEQMTIMKAGMVTISRIHVGPTEGKAALISPRAGEIAVPVIRVRIDIERMEALRNLVFIASFCSPLHQWQPRRSRSFALGSPPLPFFPVSRIPVAAESSAVKAAAETGMVTDPKFSGLGRVAKFH